MALIHRAEQEARSGNVPLNSAEGFYPADLRLARVHVLAILATNAGYDRKKKKNAWDAHGELPEFVWTGKTPMYCVQHAINAP